MDERQELRAYEGAEGPSPRVIVKAILRPPEIDPIIAHALVAKYIPVQDR